MSRTGPLILSLLLLLAAGPGLAEIKRWRVGDEAHPWNLSPVTGRLEWGRGWAVEILADDDGDGRIDEDPVELIDNDGDGLINEDPEDSFDNDDDGLVDEDPSDPQVDNDGDGLLNEDGLMTDGDDDFDGLSNEDPPDGIDNDGGGQADQGDPDCYSNPEIWEGYDAGRSETDGGNDPG